MSATHEAPTIETQRVAPDYIAHWVVKSARTEEMVRWYGTVFWAEIAYQDDEITFLTWDDESHRLAIIAVPKPVKFLFPFAKLRHRPTASTTSP